MNGAVQWDCAIPKNIDKQSAYLPVAVDASQLRAINMAAEGVSFVYMDLQEQENHRRSRQ